MSRRKLRRNFHGSDHFERRSAYVGLEVLALPALVLLLPELEGKASRNLKPIIGAVVGMVITIITIYS